MAKLGFFDGDSAQTEVINQNASRLDYAMADLGKLRELVDRQASEIVQLHAMLAGVVSLLQDNGAFTEADLERSVRQALAELSPPPPASGHAGDPYRGTPGGADAPSAADVEAAKALLARAQDHHFSKQFDEARAVYQQIVDGYGTTKQAATARQQLENLKRA